jgi:hypothetical protein
MNVRDRIVFAIPVVLLGGALVFANACDPSTPTPSPSATASSPNASLVPPPLATETLEQDAAVGGLAFDSNGRPLIPDAGAPPPEPFKTEPLQPESPEQRGVAGVSLEATFRWRDLPAPPKAPEVSQDGLRDALKQTALSWKVDLTEQGRMRIEFASSALPLSAHSEIRQRIDRYGSVLLWPGATQYRVVPAGALRTVLGERRVDVTPLTLATAKSQGEGKRFGFSTRKVELQSTVATLKLELAKVPESGEGATLFCRALVEIAGIDPKSPVCAAGELPVSAHYQWTAGGSVGVEVTAVGKRIDIQAAAMLVPPPGPQFTATGLPMVPRMIFLSRDALMSFRTQALTLPPNKDPSAPGEGFVAANASDQLVYMLLDGVPVVAVPPQAEQYVIGTPKGRFSVQWRTFLGEKVTAPEMVEMPARVTFGAPPDAGAPDGG